MYGAVGTVKKAFLNHKKCLVEVQVENSTKFLSEPDKQAILNKKHIFISIFTV